MLFAQQSFDMIGIIERLGSFGLLVYLAVHGIPAAIRYVSQSSEKIAFESRESTREIAAKSSESIGRIAEKFELISRMNCDHFSERHKEVMAALKDQSLTMKAALENLEGAIRVCRECPKPKNDD